MLRRFNMIWRIAIALCVLAALFVLFLVSCSGASSEAPTAKSLAYGEEPSPIAAATEPPESEPSDVLADETPAQTPAPTQAPTQAPTPTPVELTETADQGEEYLSKFVFLGDSTTYGLGVYNVLPFTQVWTPSNGTLTLSNQSFTNIDNYNEDGTVTNLPIAEAAALRRPEYLIITLGLNGISFMEEDSFKTEYIDLIHSVQEASPDTKIICHSIYPVIDSLVSSDIGNERINRANGWIYEIAAETGTRYLNTHDALMDATGNLDAAYNTTALDGIHLNTEGFQVVTNSVRTHGYQ